MLQDLLSKFSSPAEKQGYLQQLTAAHPYFAPAQFCLLQTLQPGEVEYGHRAAIAHLLYNNAHWLQFQLAQTDKPSLTAATSQPSGEAVSAELAEETVTAMPLADEHTESTALPAAAEEAPATVEAEMAHPETANPALAENAAVAVSSTVETEASPDELPEPAEEATTLLGTPAIPPGPLPAPEKEEMLFEPLFAVDYFASQGIKLSEEVQNSDKLGKQLKSFTEWLKSMKKTYHATLPEHALDSEADVQNIAEKSNTEDDVVTEAMAEVFALQGRKQKALAIYRKLSLLNPHKSAYFAAKIENLK